MPFTPIKFILSQNRLPTICKRKFFFFFPHLPLDIRGPVPYVTPDRGMNILYFIEFRKGFTEARSGVESVCNLKILALNSNYALLQPS